MVLFNGIFYHDKIFNKIDCNTIEGLIEYCIEQTNYEGILQIFENRILLKEIYIITEMELNYEWKNKKKKKKQYMKEQ